MMRRAVSSLGVGLFAAVLAISGFTGGATAHAATGGVFKDPYAVGTLTFCNKANQPVTHGSIYTQPFAWKTIASSQAPAGYRGHNARATLTVYQPIKYVDPGDWTGGQLTGASTFSNPLHPNVQATAVDSPLTGFVHAYPLHWNHLVEVRMIFTAVNQGAFTTAYPAAILRVTGNNWTLVKGGGTSCSAGHGVSDEAATFPQSMLLGKNPHSKSGSGHPTPAGDRSAKATPKSSTPAKAGSTASGAPTNAASVSDASNGTSNGTKTGIVLAVILLVVLGIAGWQLTRRRPRGTS